MRCLITGGAGFIGSHLVEAALDRGYEVKVLDNLSTGRRDNLSGSRGKVNLVVGDIRDRGLVNKAARGMDLIFHHAAMAEVPASVDNPILSAEVNDLGTLNVFLAARDAGVKRVVYAGSSAVYGDIKELPHRECMKPDPTSPYAAHKLIGEHYANMFGRLYGLDVVSLRYFNVFGPRQDPSSPYSGVISIFMDRLRQGLTPVVYGDGGQSRDFIYVTDVAEANLAAAEQPNLGGKIFNIGTGRSVTLNHMLSILKSVSGTDPEIEYAPFRPGDVYESRADTSNAAKYLYFRPRVTFESGLALTWDWFAPQDLIRSTLGNSTENKSTQLAR